MGIQEEEKEGKAKPITVVVVTFSSLEDLSHVGECLVKTDRSHTRQLYVPLLREFTLMCTLKWLRFEDTTLNSIYLSYSRHSTPLKNVNQDLLTSALLSPSIHPSIHPSALVLPAWPGPGLLPPPADQRPCRVQSDRRCTWFYQPPPPGWGKRSTTDACDGTERTWLTRFDLMKFLYFLFIIYFYFRTFQSCVILIDFGLVRFHLKIRGIWTNGLPHSTHQNYTTHQPAADWLSGPRR